MTEAVKSYGLPRSTQHDQVGGVANGCSAHPGALVSSGHQHSKLLNISLFGVIHLSRLLVTQPVCVCVFT
ncbi:hypothetical protein E2C01_071122 [Portunus trituberculatus]|uniref:Uncharacterized protein n=1 Tax=Portunus trituberculatus TaxID=210409 RepID=A0A5B7I755_PORTR|nr:hypothetical protein [Portunus trituberculatus]